MTNESSDGQEERRRAPVPWLQSVVVLLVAIFLLALLATVVVLPTVIDYWIVLEQKQSASTAQPATTQSTSATPAAVTASSTDKHFEALARYVTLVITVVSIGAALFAFLLRKNIREVEEDLHKRFERASSDWDSERKRLIDQFERDYEELKRAVGELPALKEKLTRYEEQAYATLSSLDDADREFANRTRKKTSEVEDATAAIDALMVEDVDKDEDDDLGGKS